MKVSTRVAPARALSAILSVSALLAGCNGPTGYTFNGNSSGSSSGTGTSSGTTSGGGGGTSTPTYTVGGTVTGLAANATGFVIQAGTGITLPIVSNGRFTFGSSLAPGAPYQVTVQAQPGTPAQFCRVTGGVGVISNADVTDVVVNCATVGKYLFAANPFDNNNGGTLAAFAIDPSSGRLTPANGSPYVLPENLPLDIALDPTGQYLYVVNTESASVSTESIGAGGQLSLDTSVASTGSAAPLSIALDPSGPYLYVGTDDTPQGTVDAYTINGGVLTPVSGTLATSVYPAGNLPYSLGVDANTGLLFGANLNDDTLFDYTITAGGMLGTVTGSPFPFGQGVSPYVVAVHPRARWLYVVDSNPAAGSLSFYTYDATGALTLVAVYSGPTLNGQPTGIAIDATGRLLYVANSGNGSVSGFLIDQTAGTLTPVAGSPFTTTGVASPVASMMVRVDPSSQFAYVSNGDAGTISPFSIDFATGALTPIGAPVSSILANGGPQALAIE